MHGNQKTSYDAERQVNGEKMSVWTLQICDDVEDQRDKAGYRYV